MMVDSSALIIKSKLLPLSFGVLAVSLTLLFFLQSGGYFRDIGGFLLIVIALLIRWKDSVFKTFKTFRRDIRFIKDEIKFQGYMRYYQWRNYTFIDLFLKQLHKDPQKTMFRCGELSWTAQQFEDFSNRVANYFKSEGIKRGETICLMMDGCPEYVGIWFGLSKIGACTALINTNLRQASLIHSINLVDGKRIIYGAEMAEALLDVSSSLNVAEYYRFERDKHEDYSRNWIDGSIELSSVLQETSTKPQAESELKKISTRDKFLYMYTSGTTGPSKAAIISYGRAMLIVMRPHLKLHMNDKDIVYTSLPLYHAAGGLLGVGQAFCFGSQIVIRPKFSVTSFWEDCIKYQCTVAQYIGEICRFLLAAPIQPHETQHNVRLMLGVGLKAQTWLRFVERFKVKQIGELYASTEGNAVLVNADGKIGVVGYIPWFLRTSNQIQLIRVNLETYEPIRDKNGLCVPCREGEPGMIVGLINPRKAEAVFDGYTNKEESESKILRNVFREGQNAYNSGDLLRFDEENCFSFVDRTGDTFRWRGENVSTTEVEAAISGQIKFKTVAVYGVEINSLEGKAGMAAILDPEKQLDLKFLADGLKKTLPSYARPLFLRVIGNFNFTGTFKLNKTNLRADGFNPALIKDPLYFIDLQTGEYRPLTQEAYDNIQNGKMRL